MGIEARGSVRVGRRRRKDLLSQRLGLLKKDDVKALLTQGLGVSEEDLAGLGKADLVDRCSEELRAAAGSSLRNLGRGKHDFPYKQILIDVADKLTEGATWLSWTAYRLDDSHPPAEIEEAILRMFEERVRRWWKGLSRKEKAAVVADLQSALRGTNVRDVKLTDGLASFVTQQVIENVIQSGVVFGLSKVSASGLPGVIGLSVVGEVGWLVLLHTVGWMAGIKIAIFGIGGYGALGGVVGSIGGAVIGGLLGLPTLIVLADGPAYRKTLPTTIMLLARIRLLKAKTSQASVEMGPGGA